MPRKDLIGRAVGQLFKHVRETSGLSISQMIKEVPTTLSTLKRIYAGKCSKELFAKHLAPLNVTVERLMEMERSQRDDEREAALCYFYRDPSEADPYGVEIVKHPRNCRIPFKDLDPKRDSVHSVSYKGIRRFWENDDVYPVYEAQQLRFNLHGGQSRRIFLFGDQINKPDLRRAFLIVLLRHAALGFSTKVLSVVDYEEAMSYMRIKSHGFLVYPGKRVFTYVMEDQRTIAITSAHPRLVANNARCFSILWEAAKDVPKFTGSNPLLSVSCEDQEIAERQALGVRLVEEVTRMTTVTIRKLRKADSD